ncbi:MAG: DUF86 domain-containing protein [Acidobacteriota bacterium]
MPRDDAVYLHHIADALDQIAEYTRGLAKQHFLSNRLVQDAVLRQLEIIGEASRNLSDTFHRAHPEIPWPALIAMRNRLVHGYFDVNVLIVWEVLENDLPALRELVDTTFNRYSPRPSIGT